MTGILVAVALSLCAFVVPSQATGCLPPPLADDKYLVLTPTLPFYEPRYGNGVKITITCKGGYLLYDNRKRDFVAGNVAKAVCRFGKYIPQIYENNYKCAKPEPACILKKTPKLIATPDKSSYKRGDEVEFDCEKGCYLIGVDETVCMRGGEFRDQIPKCVPYCVKPHQKYLIVDSDSKSFEFGGSISLSCVDGYKLRSGVDETRYCQKDGGWDSEIEDNLCEKIGCPPPPPMLLNGRFYPKSSSDKPGPDGWYKVGATVLYECDENYYLKGKDWMMCARTGKFIYRVPECIEIRCTEVMEIDNGDYEEKKDSYAIGKYVDYTCDTNYKLSTTSGRRFCRLNSDKKTASFEKAPKCERIECDEPDSIANGDFSPSSGPYYVGDSVTYECDDGYYLSGKPKAVCLLNKNKVSASFTDAPVCKPIYCDEPMTIDNGDFASTPNAPFTIGEVVSYVCDRGYEFATSFTTSTCTLQPDGISAEFSPAPSCKRVYCSFPGEPDNGSTSPKKTRYVVDESVQFSCDPCYKRFGSSKATCQQNGQFDNSLPKCLIITCSKKTVPYPDDGSFYPLKSEYKCGEKVTFKCHEAFNLINDKTSECQEDGKWSIDTKAVCDPIYCYLPKLNSNVRVTPKRTRYVYASTIEYYCKPGYSVVEDDDKTKAVCQRNGQFSNPSITCKQNKCPSPPLPNNGGITPDSEKPAYYPGDEVEYECNSWYTLEDGSDGFNECQNDGTWKRDAPTCEPPSCKGQCFSKPQKGRPCQCDYLCYKRKDCCDDRQKQCLKYSCYDRCGKPVPGACSCDRGCTDSYSRRCCRDYFQACPGAWYLGR